MKKNTNFILLTVFALSFSFLASQSILASDDIRGDEEISAQEIDAYLNHQNSPCAEACIDERLGCLDGCYAKYLQDGARINYGICKAACNRNYQDCRRDCGS